MSYNNLTGQIDKNIIEYPLFINSYDRNYDVYPDPFSFKVTFNPTGSKTQTIWKNGTPTTTTYSGTPEPHIHNSFKNVKYIKLEHVILPNQYKLTTGAHTSEIDSTATYSGDDISDDRYIVMKIDEFNSILEYSTNNLVRDSSFILHGAKSVGSRSTLYVPTDVIKEFPTSDLGNIKTMTFSFYRTDGEKLQIYGLDDDVPDRATCEALRRDSNGDWVNPDYRCLQFYEAHPLHKDIQVQILMKIGVVKPTIGKKLFS